VREKGQPEKKPEKKGKDKRAAPVKKAAAGKPAVEERKPAAPKTKPALVVNFPPRPRAAARPRPAPEAAEAPAALAAPEAGPLPLPAPVAPPPVQHVAEPLVEGFFVARVMGTEEARRHHLTGGEGHLGPEAWRGFEENLGELPMDYADDTALALPRDPHSLYVLWDFSPAARSRALEGLESPRAVLRVFDGETLVRELDFALESRSFYLHGLPAGRPYRVEAHFVGRDGRSRRIGHSTNRALLPPVGPSSDTTVRLMRMPASMPAPTEPARTAALEEREYLTWRRVPLPGSGGFEEVPEVHRERTGAELPGPGAPAARHLEVPARPQGSSEQQYLTATRAEGSSDQTPTPPPSGRER
jgi:hypothetical protein